MSALPPLLLWPGAPPPPAEPGQPLWAVLGGSECALHHFLLDPASAGRPRAEVLDRLDPLVARPLDELHVAIGPVSAAGGVWAAVADPAAIAAALADWQGLGIEPDRLVPAPLLVDPPLDPGSATLARLGPLVIVRSAERAAAIEPELAAALLPPGTALPPFAELPPLETLARPVDPPLVDLRQGAFARPRAWWRERPIRRALAAGAAAVLLLGIVLGALAATRDARLDDGYDAATRELAQRMLGREYRTAAEAAAALAAARRRHEGAALGERLALVAEAVAQAPGATIATLDLQPDGRLRLALSGSAEALNAVAGRLAAGPFPMERQGASVVLGGPDQLRPTAPGLSTAQSRYLAARADAARLGPRAARAAPPGPPVPTIEAALADRALAGRPIALSGGRAALLLPSVGATIGLPFVVHLEEAGLRAERLTIAPAGDRTVRIDLVMTSGDRS